MKLILALSLFVVLLVVNINGEETWPPAFCKELECPKYTVLKKTDDYEVREYEASKWVETTHTSRLMLFAMPKMFRKLFKYITGNNVNNEKINMTAPVITEIPDAPSKSWVPQPKTFKMGFYLPRSAPAPNCRRVKVISVPKKTYYVRQFSGYVMGMYGIKAQYTELLKRVQNPSSTFIFAGYNSPMELNNRHNEIWVEKTEKN